MEKTRVKREKKKGAEIISLSLQCAGSADRWVFDTQSCFWCCQVYLWSLISLSATQEERERATTTRREFKQDTLFNRNIIRGNPRQADKTLDWKRKKEARREIQT